MGYCRVYNAQHNDTYVVNTEELRGGKIMGYELIVSRDETATVYRALPEGTTDEYAIELWVENHNSEHTKDAYRRDIKLFRLFTRHKPLREVTFADLMAFKDSLIQGKQSSRIRTLNAVKSLLTFCHETGYIPLNVGKVLKPGKVPSKLAGRILTEEQVFAMFTREEDPYKRVLLRTLYYGGLRVSELCALTWVDVQPNGESGQLNVIGKGEKERSILLPALIYQEIAGLRGNDAIDAPVFARSTGKSLDRIEVFRIVKEAATRAGVAIAANGQSMVSPHWLRHAHATHALNHKTPIQLVRDTLGHANISVTDKYSHARPGTSSALSLSI